MEQKLWTVSIKEIAEILRRHRMWINGEEGGECANLEYANLEHVNLVRTNLEHANLAHANLSFANLSFANLKHTYLEGANLEDANLEGANLEDANLVLANLAHANLKYADMDYSCLPLWCGSLAAQFDDRQLRQIAYHLVKAGLNSPNASEKTKLELSKLVDFANGFHRVNECGEIEWIGHDADGAS